MEVFMLQMCAVGLLVANGVIWTIGIMWYREARRIENRVGLMRQERETHERK